MKYRKLVVAALTIALVLVVPKKAHAATCWEEYEYNAMVAYAKVESCMADVQENYAWYNPAKVNAISLCSLNFASDAIENGAKYAKCMAVDVFTAKNGN
jgi:hypothetical protein